jgi:hypothetical protein
VPFRNPHYHQATDTPDKLDYDRLALVVNGVEKTIAALGKLFAWERFSHWSYYSSRAQWQATRLP